MIVLKVAEEHHPDVRLQVLANRSESHRGGLDRAVGLGVVEPTLKLGDGAVIEVVEVQCSEVIGQSVPQKRIAAHPPIMKREIGARVKLGRWGSPDSAPQGHPIVRTLGLLTLHFVNLGSDSLEHLGGKVIHLRRATDQLEIF